MYELFEHTADLGLRVRAPDLNTLFREAAVGLFSMMVDDLKTVNPIHECTVMLDGTDKEFLLFDWLRHLLYLFDSARELYSEFEIIVTDEGLSAIAFGEPLDPERHPLGREVKAITYHELKVEQTADGWLAEVIVDI